MSDKTPQETVDELLASMPADIQLEMYTTLRQLFLLEKLCPIGLDAMPESWSDEKKQGVKENIVENVSQCNGREMLEYAVYDFTPSDWEDEGSLWEEWQDECADE